MTMFHLFHDLPAVVVYMRQQSMAISAAGNGDYQRGRAAAYAEVAYTLGHAYLEVASPPSLLK
jgi:hypothetical protein